MTDILVEWVDLPESEKEKWRKYSPRYELITITIAGYVTWPKHLSEKGKIAFLKDWIKNQKHMANHAVFPGEEDGKKNNQVS